MSFKKTLLISVAILLSVADNTLANTPFLPDSITLRNHTAHGNAHGDHWRTTQSLSDNTLQLLSAIENAKIHGLNPERYHHSQIKQFLSANHKDSVQTRISRNSTATNTSSSNDNRPLPIKDNTAQINGTPASSPIEGTRLNELFDAAFKRLLLDLGQGAVNPELLPDRRYREPPRVPTDTLYSAVVAGTLSVKEALNQVIQKHPQYQLLTHKMRDLLTEQVTDTPRVIIETENIESLYDAEELIISLRQRLMETGDLPHSRLHIPRFDRNLRDALKRFQSRQGLDQSGWLDSATQASLNASVEDDIRSVSNNLERWRWMPRELGEVHIDINIPQAQLRVLRNQEVLLDMPVVVGAEETVTPVFSEEMTYMDVNPNWTVPASITNRELIPLELRNPGYLAENHFRYLTRENGQLVQVPAYKVNRSDFEKTHFPYILQQRGGPWNTLGRMKFMMPNPYAIYLHDTQYREHFNLTTRAYSNGCIRLSEPEKLAQQLLAIDNRDVSYIDAVIQSKKLKRVTFRTAIPTHLRYMTAWVDGQGNLQKRQDIYNYDSALAAELMLANQTIKHQSQLTH